MDVWGQPEQAVRQRADAEQQQIDDEVRIGFYSVVHGFYHFHSVVYGASRFSCMHAWAVASQL
jgi:hypothetical protein